MVDSIEQLIEFFKDYLMIHHQNDDDVLKYRQVSIAILEYFYPLLDSSSDEYEVKRQHLMIIWMFHMKYSDVTFLRSLYELLYSFRNMSLKYSCPQFEDILDTISHLLSLRILIEDDLVSFDEIKDTFDEVKTGLVNDYKVAEVFADTKRLLQLQ
jgi:hypothetical protein